MSRTPQRRTQKQFAPQSSRSSMLSTRPLRNAFPRRGRVTSKGRSLSCRGLEMAGRVQARSHSPGGHITCATLRLLAHRRLVDRKVPCLVCQPRALEPGRL